MDVPFVIMSDCYRFVKNKDSANAPGACVRTFAFRSAITPHWQIPKSSPSASMPIADRRQPYCQPIRARHVACPASLATVWIAAVVSLVIALRTACENVYAADYVIHVSIDGLNAQTMQSVVVDGSAPTIERLEREGAWTTNARADYTHTITLPNHTTMITGRPVLPPKGMRRQFIMDLS